MNKQRPASREFFRFETQTKLFSRVLNSLDIGNGGLVADYGCGYGRHSLQLAINSINVVAIDSEWSRLSYIQDNKSAYLRSLNLDNTPGSITLVQSDIVKYKIPVQDEHLAGAVCIHFPDYEILKRIIPSIKPGGFLLFETFDGHGHNYKQLPAAGHLKNILEENFTLNYYKERLVSPTELQRVTVRMFGYRHK